MVLIINLEGFLCETFVVLTFLTDDHHKITYGNQCSKESHLSDVH